MGFVASMIKRSCRKNLGSNLQLQSILNNAMMRFQKNSLRVKVAKDHLPYNEIILKFNEKLQDTWGAIPAAFLKVKLL